MLARIPIAFEQPFGELLRASPSIALLGLFALQRAKLLFRARRNARRLFQHFTVVSSFGLGGFELAKLLRVP
jgi:hypothetical protein